MAGPDPRRSSRARTSQSQSQHSTSSSTSGRGERSTRSFVKTGSPQKSTPSASLASEPPEDTVATGDEILLRSRRPRPREDDADQASVIASEIEMVNDGDEMQDDDEAVRCICGRDEYPGPPSFEDLKLAAKDGIDLDSVFPAEITEDLAGFYVQCDVCKVWQHGACVGLTNDDTLPEYYYCEECRKDLHKIFTSSNGPRFSIYLPLNRQSSSRSGSIVKDGTRSPKGKDGKSSRPSSTNQTSKRRSTMNSRDAAYDEEEQLRRAIEASKEEVSLDKAETVTSSKRAKRGRSDSEEKLEGAKRQRTSSRSASPTVEKQLAGTDDSDDALAARNGSSKKSRNTAARNNPSSTMPAGIPRERTRDEKEQQRAEAANKRKGRAERRRADDSDPSEEIPLAARAGTNRSGAVANAASTSNPAPASANAAPAATSTAAVAAVATTIAPTPATAAMAAPTAQAPEPPSASQPSPDTPSAASAAPAPSHSKSKGGKPTHRKKGRNQYTKDRDSRGEDSPKRSQSRDVQDAGHSRSGGGEGGKSGSRSKGGMNSRITMSELKRRATAMFDYISKTQLELAGEAPPTPAHASRRSSAQNGPSSTVPLIMVNGTDETSPKKPPDNSQALVTTVADKDDPAASAPKEFKDLSCVEMMDYLTRDLVHWQSQFAA